MTRRDSDSPNWGGKRQGAGHPITGKAIVWKSLTTSEATYKRLKTYAKDNGLTLHQAVTEAVKRLN